MQAAWAYSNNVNFLASGLNNPRYKNAGSGIYASRKGVLVAVMPDVLTTQLLIARVPLLNNTSVDTIQKGNIVTVDSNQTDRGLNFFHYDFQKAHSKIVNITDKSSEMEYVDGDNFFKCTLLVKHSTDSCGSSNVTYRLIAYSGERTYVGLKTVAIEICALVACAADDIASCGEKPIFDQYSLLTFHNIEIWLDSRKDLSTFPVTLDQNILPLDTDYFEFKRYSEKQNSFLKESISMNLTKAHNGLISFGIFRG